MIELPENILQEPGAAYYLPGYLNAEQQEQLWAYLLEAIAWEQKEIRLFGKPVLEPRLTACAGEEGIEYSYSGRLLRASAWQGLLLSLAEQLNSDFELAEKPFNFVLLNYYRDGKDSMAWHSDDEPELGDNPFVGSISLGAERDMLFRRKKAARGEKSRKCLLESGSLLLMGSAMQQHWQHQVPKRKNLAAKRINLTFRHIFPKKSVF